MNDFYRSSLSDRPCEHRHQTFEAAQRCALKRIQAGESYVGHPMEEGDAEQCVRKYHSCGERVGG